MQVVLEKDELNISKCELDYGCGRSIFNSVQANGMIKKTSVASIWPIDLTSEVYSGFSDEAPTQLVQSDIDSILDLSLVSKGNWIYWTSELYSLGRCYREWLNLPIWLRLPIYGDHGVTFSDSLAPHEL